MSAREECPYCGSENGMDYKPGGRLECPDCGAEKLC